MNPKTLQAQSAILTRSATSHFDRSEFGASARKEFDGARLAFGSRDALRAAADLAKVLARQTEGLDREDLTLDPALRLVGLAEGVNALACLMCNGVPRRQAGFGGKTYVGGSWTESDEILQEKTRAALIADMNAILQPYGARVVSSYGDPRGHVVHIAFADGASNRGGSEKVWGL